MNLSLLLLSSLIFSFSANAAIKPFLKANEVFTADSKKRNVYIKEGLITGGDQSTSDVIILDIRYAINRGYERIVLDVEGNQSGEVSMLEKAPYYHFAVSPENKRIVVTIWGKPKLAFNFKKVESMFRKSRVIQKVELLPILENDRWTFVLHLKDDYPIEIFELSNPVRIIADIQSHMR